MVGAWMLGWMFGCPKVLLHVANLAKRNKAPPEVTMSFAFFTGGNKEEEEQRAARVVYARCVLWCAVLCVLCVCVC